MMYCVDPAGLKGRNPAVKKHKRVKGKFTTKGPNWHFFSRWTHKTNGLSERYILSCNIWMLSYNKPQGNIS